MLKPIIQLKKVRVTYAKGKANEMIALHDIDLEIYEGEYIVFLGPSGCGKSTLLYTIAGLEIPSSGEVIVANKNLMSVTPAEKIEFYRTTIGMIFQAFYLVAHLSAADNIMLSGMFAGADVIERKKKANILMNRFEITDYKDRKPSNMSGGQQQRTAIARALMNNPHIILADEPVGNLDSKNAITVLDLLADIHRLEGKTVIQVTHNANDARYADRVFHMKDGRIEKVVVNSNPYRGASIDSTETSEIKNETVHTLDTELSKLAKFYPQLSEIELRALLIMRTVFIPYNFDTEQKITKAIEKFIKKDIDFDGLVHELDTNQDGAGLYFPKAKHSAVKIKKLFDEIQLVSNINSKSTSVDLNLASRSITDFILETYEGKVTPEEKLFITSALERRLSGSLNEQDLRNHLSLKKSQGGFSLHSRTIEHFTREIEIIISK